MATKAATHRPKTRIRRRIVRITIALALAFAAVLAALWFAVIPVVVRDRVDRILANFEPHRRQFTIESIGLKHLRVSGIVLGDQPWLSVSNANVTFDSFAVLNGDVESLELSDVIWRIAVREDVVDWGVQTQDDDATETGAIELPFHSAAVRNGEIVVQAGNRTMHASVEIDGKKDSTGGFAGSFALPRVRHDAHSLGNAHGSFSFDGERVEMQARWSVIEAQPMALKVWMEVADESVAGMLEVVQPPFAVEQATSLLAMFPAMDGVQAQGRVAIDGTIPIGTVAGDPRLTIRAGDVVLAHPEWPLAIASASGELNFDSLQPLRTAGPQRLRVASATTGELDIFDGEMLVEMDAAGSVSISQARWEMSDGGTYAASPATIDLAEPRIATTISGSNISLDFWLRLLSGDRADGQGQLRGEFTVDWNPQSRPRIHFTGGSLVATPPTGYIRVHDASMLREALEQSDSRFAVDAALRTVKENIVDALQDLGFTRLTMQFVPDGPHTMLRAELEGQGRRGERAQRFSGLVVNIGRFAETLQHVLDATAATEGLDRLLEQQVDEDSAVPPLGAPQPFRP